MCEAQCLSMQCWPVEIFQCLPDHCLPADTTSQLALHQHDRKRLPCNVATRYGGTLGITERNSRIQVTVSVRGANVTPLIAQQCHGLMPEGLGSKSRN